MPEHISGFHIMASHSDSPCFKIKENPEIGVAEKYVKLNVEKYGGMLMSTWFDRPLSVAGRLVTENEGKNNHPSGEHGPGHRDYSESGNPYEPEY